MLLPVLALVFASPTLWVVTRLPPELGCNAAGLAQALRSLHPSAEVAAEGRPTEDDLEAQLTTSALGFHLAVRGGAVPLDRELPAATCDQAIDLAALVLERYLDDLPKLAGHPEAAARSGGTAHPFGVSAEVGVLGSQVAPGFAGGVLAELGLQLRFLRAALEVDLSLPGDSPISTALPVGSYRVQPLRAQALGGVALHLGPGSVEGDLAFGATLNWVSIEQSLLPKRPGGFAADPFVGLRLGYAISLPWQSFVSVRWEECLTLRRTEFSVATNSDYPGPLASTAEPRFGAVVSLSVGREFY